MTSLTAPGQVSPLNLILPRLAIQAVIFPLGQPLWPALWGALGKPITKNGEPGYEFVERIKD